MELVLEGPVVVSRRGSEELRLACQQQDRLSPSAPQLVERPDREVLALPRGDLRDYADHDAIGESEC